MRRSPTPLHENASQPTELLLEVFERGNFVLVEKHEGDEELPEGVILRARGILGEVDALNQNGRIYPRPIMAREIRKIQGPLKRREVFVLSDHPGWSDPFQGSMGKVAGILHTVELQDEKEGNAIFGEIDFVETEAGRDAAAIVKAGGKPGISQRGFGSISHEDEFVDFQGKTIANAAVIGTDYTLESFDLVIGPSVKRAGVKGFREENSMNKPILLTALTLALLTEHRSDLVDEVKNEAKKDFEKDHATKVETAKTEAVDAARAEWESEHATALSLEATISERKIEDPKAWFESNDGKLSEATARAATAEKKLADAETAKKTAVEESERTAKLRTILRENCAENPSVFVRCEALAFDENGKPAMTPTALEAVIADAFKNESKAADPSKPPRGKGKVAEESGNAEPDEEKILAEKEELAAVNSMRANAGLPLLESLSAKPN